jgi:hypothetical protein
LARDCPTKLFYTGKPEYPDQSQGDSFLQSLAEGGFQVGELAKLYYDPDLKNDIKEIDYESSLRKTSELLEKNKVVIFEGAINYKDLLIRADVLVKSGKNLRLVEVKAKFFAGTTEDDFLDSKGSISNSYRSYLEDVAFQKYVLLNAFPELHVSASLLLVDKNSHATVNGLNQIFSIQKNRGRTEAVINAEKLKEVGLGEKILIEIPVDGIIDTIYQEIDEDGSSFIDKIHLYSNHYKKDKKIATPVGLHCQHCEFTATENELSEGKKSGFRECWKEQKSLKDVDFQRKFIFDIWNYRGKRDKINQGIYFIDQMDKSDFDIQLTPDGMSTGKRQWLQVKSAQASGSGKPKDFLDKDGLSRFMDSVVYPLHFIDFETTSVAIPFFQGMKPYEGIAFQYSHHIMHENGKIEHRGQFLHTETDEFPNFHFVRNLKKELEMDNGTIFRYANHENSFLNAIHDQLSESKEKDRKSLMGWIQSITKSGSTPSDTRRGNRCMEDLLELVVKYHYHPYMEGSNSIKSVLPAVIRSSKYIQKKYSKPIYGTEEIPSLNFNNHSWIAYSENKEVLNPYQQLPPIFSAGAKDEYDPEIRKYLDSVPLEYLADGGAALTAYSLVLNSKKYPVVQSALKTALLKYCELDTFAMVLIWENWMEKLGRL